MNPWRNVALLDSCTDRKQDDLGHRFHPGGHYFPVMSPRIPDEFGLFTVVRRGKSVI